MLILAIVFIVIGLWIAFELWRAPLGEETENGYREIRPTKKLSDLWKRKNK